MNNAKAYYAQKLLKYSVWLRYCAEDSSLIKISAEYNQAAHSKLDLVYPVSINNRHILTTNVPFHMSVKIFGDSTPELSDEAFRRLAPHEAALKQPIDESKLHIMPYKFQGTSGDLNHVLVIHGMPSHLNSIYDANQDIGKIYPEKFSHITVDKEIWDKVNEGHLQPNDIGLKFHPAELRSGNQVLKTY